MARKVLFLLPLAASSLAQSQLSTTSIFVPVEYVSNTYSASIAGADATATTYVFPPGCEDSSCGPVTVIQGPGTALFNETDQPITTIYNCSLYPSTGDPTSASCTLSSTSPGYDFPSPVTKHYPENSGDAFPLYKAVITAGDVPDIWGSATGTSSRASLFNPITHEPLSTTTTTMSARSSASAESSSTEDRATTSMPTSTTMVSSQAAVTTASTTSSMSGAAALKPLPLLPGVVFCSLMSIFAL